MNQNFFLHRWATFSACTKKMSDNNNPKAKQKVTLVVEDPSSSPSQGSSCLRNTCSTVNGSMSFSGCSLGVTNSTVALESSSMEHHLSYAKLSTRSATTSVQFNFDANGAMYRSTTICVEEATMRDRGESSEQPSSSSAPALPNITLQPPSAESCFATFQPLSTVDEDDGPPIMNRTRSIARGSGDGSHEDPLTYFSPTVSTCVVVPQPQKDAPSGASVAGPAPSYSKEDDEDEEDTETDSSTDDVFRLHHNPHMTTFSAQQELSNGALSPQSSSSKGNPLDP